MKKHKMYCKDGKVHEVSSVKKHKALMKKGCGHKKKKGVNYKPANTGGEKKPVVVKANTTGGKEKYEKRAKRLAELHKKGIRKS